MQIRLTTTLLFGAAALIAGGCAPLTNGTTGVGTGCVAAIVEDDPGSQVPINTPGVPLGAGTGSTSQLAEAFLVTATQVVPEVQIKLDVVTPAQSTLGASISVQLEQDTLTSTAGNASAPTTPLGSPVTSGTIVATQSIPASTVNASPSSSSTNPAFYNFCFAGAIGVNCPTPGIGATTAGVTLNAGQFYWIVVTTSAPGTATSFVEWRGTSTSTVDYLGYVFLNSLNWLPVKGAGTSNFNFDFKLGC
jgi:hypothetical protein